MKEGDIYHWRWRGAEHNTRSYCCYSQIAVVWKGRLHDTYCGVLDAEAPLEQAQMEIEFLGNPDEMLKLMAGFENFYRPEDIVDTRHSNNLRAPIYLKLGAQRDGAIMQVWANAEKEKNQAEIQKANRRLKSLEKALTQIAPGELDAVYL